MQDATTKMDIIEAAPTDSNAVKLRNVHNGVTISITNSNVTLCASVGPSLPFSSSCTGKIASDNGRSMSRNKTPYPTIVKKQMVDTNPMEKYFACGPNAEQATDSKLTVPFRLLFDNMDDDDEDDDIRIDNLDASIRK